MIERFKVKNKTTSREVIFGQDIDCDYVYKSDGLDWGTAPAQHNTYNYLNQIGVTISSTMIKERDITITGYVYYWLTKDDMMALDRSQWNSYGYEIIKNKKEDLNSIINPLDYLVLSINDYFIEGKPAASIAYGNTEQTNNTYFCEFMFTLYCANPMFKKNTIMKTIINGDIPMLHSPFIIPPFGIVGGRRVNYLMLSVENEGDVQIGCRIILTAKDEVVNPQIENIGTGETITIKKTMQQGEKIIINTSDGPEKGVIGIIDGVEYNYFKYWSFDNSWFKCQVGTTLIGYSTENGAEDSLDVVIEINPEKYALMEM